ncbi:MAG: glycosyltransferase family 2 protein [Candidatus Babeliales bacterium]|jgi:glycosyltransferase involved in cell wall biosynthesis
MKTKVLFVVLFHVCFLSATFIESFGKERLWKQLKDIQPAVNKHFVVVIASYNNQNWYKKNLNSVFNQTYKNYHVIYIDDCSSDKTGALVEQYVKEQHQELHVTLIKNKERRGAMANYYEAIHSCGAASIIVQLDGDDWFAHDHVLDLLNRVYNDPNVWLTYGQFKRYPSGEKGYCQEIPSKIIETNEFRSYKWVTSALRTFYVGLFKLIKKEDLLFNGQFLPMTHDLAIMFPMLEMAGSRIKFIPDVLYIYNNATVLNDHKVNGALQKTLNHFIRAKEKYTPLAKAS